MAGDISAPFEDVADSGNAPRIKLALCVCFHYVEERLKYLAALGARLGTLAQTVAATVVTDSVLPEQHRRITDSFRKHGADVAIFAPQGLGHPYLLPWSHFVVMREKFKDPSFSHFLYMEDDLLCTQEHIKYLLEAGSMLRPVGLIPALFRVEQNPIDREWYCTDLRLRVDMRACHTISLSVESGLGFINLPSSYQGMYFLDRELMAEHLDGPSSSPDYGPWNIREKAAQGLTFMGVPEGLTSRVMVPYYAKEKRIAQSCLLHHLTNSYALNLEMPFAKIKVKDVFL